MPLANYEIQVLNTMLAGSMDRDRIDRLLESGKVSVRETTTAGYFINIYCPNISSHKQTVSEPVLIGKTAGVEVGFVVFIDHEEITLECHGWGGSDLLNNLRTLNLEVETSNG